jgi:formate-dependent nitrite reductase cytochrome c552 subunit
VKLLENTEKKQTQKIRQINIQIDELVVQQSFAVAEKNQAAKVAANLKALVN